MENDYDIINTYQLEYRGLVNYSQLAFNMCALHKVKYVMQVSLLKTLATKYKSTVNTMAKKYKAEITVKGKKYVVLQVKLPRKDKTPLIATWGGIALRGDIRATIEDQPPRHYAPYSELEQRLLADCCEWCGSQDIEGHHVRAMKDLHEYPGRHKPEWVKRMIALRRKTMFFCRTCHMDVQFGRPMRREPISLKEVKAVQKEVRKKLLTQA
jgi:hypothetical protein